MVLSRSMVIPVIACLFWVMAGCATVPPKSGYSSFSGYAESVFRHQNELTSRLMMLNEAEQLPDNDEFENAEEALADACRLLNEYAERESSGDSMGLRFKAKVQGSVEGCDNSIQRMEDLLTKLGKGR